MDKLANYWKLNKQAAHKAACLKFAFSPQAAKGIPDRAQYGDVSTLPVNSLLKFIIQKHEAERAGKHYDVRVGTPDSGLLSWATRKELPKPGQKPIALFQQPVHNYAYGDFQGTIPKGQYGAGKVRTHHKGEVLITKVAPKEVHFSTASTGEPERFILKHTDDRRWLLINSTPTKAVPYEKVHYTSIPKEKAEDILSNLQPHSSVQAKIDGAAGLTQLFKDKFDVVSYRAAKNTGHPITHLERLFRGRPSSNIPKDLVGSVLRGEIYGVKDQKAISPQELSGLLNSGLAKSIRRQQERGIVLKKLLFDIPQYGNKKITNTTPYEKRISLLRDVFNRAQLPKEHFELPEEAKGPQEALNLWEQIRSGKHPLTREGIVIHAQTKKPTKIKLTNDTDVYIRGIVPGENKWLNRGAGAFEYSHTPTGPVVGRVGSGFEDSTRTDMFAHPEKYIGRVAKIISMGKMPSGALFQPSFAGLHEDYTQA